MSSIRYFCIPCTLESSILPWSMQFWYSIPVLFIHLVVVLLITACTCMHAFHCYFWQLKLTTFGSCKCIYFVKFNHFCQGPKDVQFILKITTQLTLQQQFNGTAVMHYASIWINHRDYFFYHFAELALITYWMCSWMVFIGHKNWQLDLASLLLI